MFGSGGNDPNAPRPPASKPPFSAVSSTTAGFTFGLPTTTANLQNPAFGNVNPAPASANLFALPTTTASFQTPQFNMPSALSGPPLFATAATSSSANAPKVFGQGAAVFSSSNAPTTTMTRSNLFQQNATAFGTTSSSSAFTPSRSILPQGNTKPLFTTATSTTASAFPSATSSVSTNIFGKPPQQDSVPSSNIFGAKLSTGGSTAFGGFAATSQQTSNVFGDTAKVTQPAFAAASSGDGNVFKPSVVKPSTPGFQFGASSSTASAPFSFASTSSSSNVFASTSFKSSNQNVFKKPDAKPHAEAPDSSLSTKQGSKRAVEDDEEHVAKSQAKSKPNPPSSRPILQRPMLSGRLFGHALSDLQKSKPSKTKQSPPQSAVSSKSKDAKQQQRWGEKEPVARAKGRLSTMEEISKLKSIVIQGLPDSYNNNETMRELFLPYGAIHRIHCIQSRYSCIIHFVSHDSAALAKQQGLERFQNSDNMGIFWSAPRRTSKSTDPREKKGETKVSEKPSYSSDDVDDELRSMTSGTDDMESQAFESRHDEPGKDSKKTAKQRTTKRGGKAKRRRESEESLLSVMEKPAFTAGERYLVLQSQDKLLRERRKKQSSLATAKIMVGTCPDMCPEKERYFREDKRQLHSYEISYQAMQQGEEPKVDHRVAIKEYSRSSADQEEPLPHELRPPSVLKMTMDYLICNVVDHSDVLTNLADWYDFIWNRTRSIRKDITQQHLCDLTCVDLVEKCARFHIHCAERLCEEDLSDFDPKINNENLTKCLQTLKHFYHDLGLKNEACPNEPEFRAYDVLLNLNDANILWEVQQLRADVQRSPPVRFAVQAFAALNSNNYVRFFKLAEQASYLGSCIMHRYFLQVRSKALHTITKAYTAPAHKTPYPAVELMKILAFENDREAEIFCVKHGLSVMEHFIILDRANISNPEGTVRLCRAKQLIEAKCRSHIAQIVNNGRLPPNPLSYHQPHCSFDSNGFLTKALVNARTGSVDEESDSASVASLEKRTTDKQVKELTQSEHMQLQQANAILSDVINEEVPSIVKNVGNNLLTNLAILQKIERDVLMWLLGDVIDSGLKQVAEETLNEEREDARRKSLEHEKQVAEAIAFRMKQMETKVVDEIIEEIVDEVVCNETHRVVRKLREEEALFLQQFVHSTSLEITARMLHEEMNRAINEVIFEVYRQDVIERKQRLTIIGCNLKRLRILTYFNRWRANVTKKQKNRRNALEFPSIPGRQQAWRSATSQKFTDMKLPMERLAQQERITRLFDMTYGFQKLNDLMNSAPIDINEVARSMIAKEKTAKNIYWKLIVSLPSRCTPYDEPNRFAKWLREKIARNRNQMKKKIQLWCLFSINVSSSPLSPARYLTFCVVGAEGAIDDLDVRRRNFLGSHGIVFVLHRPRDMHNWFIAYERLRLLLLQNQYQPPLPLVVLLCGWTANEFGTDNGSKHLQLENLRIESAICGYVVHSIPNLDSMTAHSVLMQALTELAQGKPELPGLNCQTMTSFVDDVMTRYFFVPIYQDLANRRQCGYVHQQPENLIALYNASVEHAYKVACSSSLEKISWPVSQLAGSSQHPNLPQLDWNCKRHLTKLGNTILELKLPAFVTNVTDDWTSVVGQINDYTSSLTPRETAQEHMLKKIEIALGKTWKRFNKRCRALFSVQDVDPSSLDVDWADVVHVWVDHQMSTLVPPESEENVYYLEEELENFDFPREWRTILREGGSEELESSHKSMKRAVSKRLSETAVRLESKPKIEPPKANVGSDFNVEELLAKISQEKEHAKKLDEMLQNHISSSMEEARTPLKVFKGDQDEDHNQIWNSPRQTEGTSVVGNLSSRPSLGDQVAELKRSIQEQRMQDAVFEKRLKYLNCL